MDDCRQNESKRAEMSKAIGSMMYAAQLTRQDICSAVSLLSRYNQNPEKPHWLAVKRVLRYLRGTANAKLFFTEAADPNIIVIATPIGPAIATIADQ